MILTEKREAGCRVTRHVGLSSVFVGEGGKQKGDEDIKHLCSAHPTSI
jgi:hypothetical protein